MPESAIGKHSGKTSQLAKRVGQLLVLAVLCSPAVPSEAADDVAAFYAGKTVNIEVGFSAGGGYDLYARALQPYLSKHIPGNPHIIVKNMPGAGSYKLTAWMQAVAPRDGTEIATVTRGAPVEEMLGGLKTNFDPAAANWVGSMNNEVSVCIVMATTGAKTIDDLRKREFSFGTQGKGSDSELFAIFVKNLFGLHLKAITGYPGTTESILAMERGEVDGNCGWSWTTAKQAHPEWFKNNTVNIIMQMGLTKHPDLPNVPLIGDFAKTDAERAQIELIMARQIMGRPFFMPPGVPAERVSAMRKAFMETLTDPEFVAAADRLKLEVNPVSGEDVQALVNRMLKTPADVVAETRRNIEGGN